MKKVMLSILCPSYNHEKFVGYFINSLLRQTNPNWELVIVDDCSTDNNVAEIKKFSDKRIKLVQNNFNKGVNCGLNAAFSASSGKYVSFCASDDMLTEDYVENVLNTFAENPDKSLIYSNLQLIDNKNKFLNQTWYNHNGDRYDALYTMFMQRNCMLSPGMAITRELLSQIMPLDIPLSQYQDYKMHVDLLLKSDFIIMDKICVLYRKNDSQSGLSASNTITEHAKHLETNLLMNSFLKIQDVNLLKNIFKDNLNQFNKISSDTIPFVLGQLALQSDDMYKKVWGYNQIVRFINSMENYALVNKLYGFSYKNFLGLSGQFCKSTTEIKYYKYKKLFNVSCFIILVLLFALFGVLFI